ncbi:helix-turn-helix domain-containing protein [Rhizobium skierniewicense]|uniref:helix-turn-helix domain-containing protein n=1 Tax=Rhizobium skierniewicense TaxID=984260 RepID=UPI00235759C2|nr:helix-turn-helix domain-containing protein [Rhizobium skierniewicense]
MTPPSTRTGETPDRWMRHHRIELAKTMMRATTLPVSRIATLCGFKNREHFIRVCSLLAGITPALGESIFLIDRRTSGCCSPRNCVRAGLLLLRADFGTNEVLCPSDRELSFGEGPRRVEIQLCQT